MSKQTGARGDMNVMNVMNVLGYTLPQGELLEAIYDPVHRTGSLVHLTKSGEVKVADEFNFGDTRYYPVVDKHIKKGRILLPTEYKPAEVEPTKLLAGIQEAIHKYVDLDPLYEPLAARYIMMTWQYDLFHKVPYLRIIGPAGTGKSRLLDVAAALCYHPSRLGESFTPAVIFRWIEDHPGTLILDEMSYEKSDASNTIAQILNGGYARGGSVFRTEKTEKGFEPQAYSTFGPKVIAMRRPFQDDALESRLISFISREATRPDIIRNIPPHESWEEMIELRNSLLSFRLQYHRMIDIERNVRGLEGYDPRMVEIMLPLLHITGETRLPDDIREYMDRLKQERIANLGLSDDGRVAEAVVQLVAGRNSYTPTVHEITQVVNQKEATNYQLSDRKVGQIISGLGLHKERKTAGFIVYISPDEVRNLSKRYGIPLDDDLGISENVHNVHNVHDVRLDPILSIYPTRNNGYHQPTEPLSRP